MVSLGFLEGTLGMRAARLNLFVALHSDRGLAHLFLCPDPGMVQALVTGPLAAPKNVGGKQHLSKLDNVTKISFLLA